MYLCRDIEGYSLKAIGNVMGGRDHTTIIHGADKIAEMINKNESTKNVVEILKKKLAPV